MGSKRVKEVACLNGDEHDFKNIMELPDHVNAPERLFQTFGNITRASCVGKLTNK